MYILNWNPNERVVEAGLGGKVTHGEANCFLDDFRSLVVSDEVREFDLVVDYAKAHDVDEYVNGVLDSVREVARFAGAKTVTFVTPSEVDVAVWTNARLQQVLEGSERYVAYGLAA